MDPILKRNNYKATTPTTYRYLAYMLSAQNRKCSTPLCRDGLRNFAHVFCEPLATRSRRVCFSFSSRTSGLFKAPKYPPPKKTRPPIIRIRRCISHAPGAAFQARLLDNQDGANTIPYYMPLESSLQDVSNADLFWHRHNSDCGDIEHGKSAQGVLVLYTPSYTASTVRVRR